MPKWNPGQWKHGRKPAPTMEIPFHSHPLRMSNSQSRIGREWLSSSCAELLSKCCAAKASIGARAPPAVASVPSDSSRFLLRFFGRPSCLKSGYTAVSPKEGPRSAAIAIACQVLVELSLRLRPQSQTKGFYQPLGNSTSIIYTNRQILRVSTWKNIYIYIYV